MKLIKTKLKSASNYVKILMLFIVVSGFTGALGGAVGGAFHLLVELANDYRNDHRYLIFFLPLAGILIVFLYRLLRLKHDPGTNRVITSVRDENGVPFAMAPLILISTTLTHLFGGSAGREGAALQLGGSIGYTSGRIFRLDDKHMPIVVMCGMSAVFSALFGTPLTAVFFAMEFVSVGVIYYSALVPCLIASYLAYYISSLYGNEPVRFLISNVPHIDVKTVITVGILAVFCAVLSIAFCLLMKYSRIYATKYIKNDYLRIFIGGVVVVLLTMIVGCSDYNGAGMNIIENAMNGDAKYTAFLMKMIFTAFTISFGFKGGEIVPTFFIGATFGCVVGPFLGLPASFSAAVGLLALFVGVVNSPIATLILSIELFGTEGLLLYAVAIFISYMLSGYYSLYSEQKIIYSKLGAEYINRNAK